MNLGRNLLMLVLAVMGASGQAQTPPLPLTGKWEGKLKVGKLELRLGMEFSQNADGSWTGKLHSIDQGVNNLPIPRIDFAEPKLRAELPAFQAAFPAVLDAKKATLIGRWEQAGQSFPLHLKRVEAFSTVNRPQHPKKPYPYREEEVQFVNPKGGGHRLAGTLTLPQGTGPFPAAVLISGSGPHDRDETLLGHKPFLVLADHLTRQGIAVLRYDDRGVGQSTGRHDTATTADFATDARAAVDFLRTRPDIDARRIGLIGHSEGGMIAPLVAAGASDIAYIVLLAGPGESTGELLLAQQIAVLRSEGETPVHIDAFVKIMRQWIALAQSDLSNPELRQRMNESLDQAIAELPQELRREVEKNRKLLTDQAIEQLSTPWFRYFLRYDPQAVLQKVRCPILALNGEKDMQVRAKENLAGIAEAGKKSGNSEVTVKELKGLNHLFQTCSTGAVSEYNQIEETFSPTALTEISTWILKRKPIP